MIMYLTFWAKHNEHDRAIHKETRKSVKDGLTIEWAASLENVLLNKLQCY